ncbi:MAG: AAA family ATPase [Chloroflexota bacterium]|nr:AAA family ATPase [Chloroflexota bacterium]
MAFVGRERELVELAEALQLAAEGEMGRVVLAGSAGIGMSRLLDELESRLVDVPGIIVARGHATEPRAALPYAVLAEALGSALAALPAEHFAAVVGPATHDLTALLPAIAPRLDASGISRLAPALEATDQIGSRVVESLRGTLERLAQTGVVLLALEDLHWSDPATRRFVESLQDITHPLSVCLLVSYQPDELHRRHPAQEFVSGLLRAPGVRIIEPAPLSDGELTALCTALEGERPSGSFLAALSEGSRGNPLLATQLITARRALEGLRLSDPFDEVLSARLDALSPGALRAVRLLAAIRGPSTRATCLDLALSDGHLSAKDINEALKSGLVEERGEPKSLALAHELYAEGIEALALPQERHGYHIALAGSPHLVAAEAAWHWTTASRHAQARVAHRAAGAAAERLDPGETALFHYLRALELGGSMDDDGSDGSVELAATLSAAARAAAVSGSFRRAAALVRRAIDSRPRWRPAPRTGGRRPEETDVERAARREASLRLAELHIQSGRYRWDGGDLVGGMSALHQALETMPPGPGQGRARALAVLAQHLMIDGRFEESAALAADARTVAAEAGPAALAESGHATCTLGVDTAYLGQLDRGLELLEEATTIARSTGRLDDLMRAYANRTTLLDLDSRREQALAVVNEGIRDARDAGLGATYGAFLRGNAADILFMLGRWEESEVECRAGLAARPAGVAWFSPILYLGLVLVESRADEEAARLVGRTLLQLEQVPAGQWTALVLRTAVSLLLWRGQVDDAVTVATGAWERVMETDDAGQIAMAASTCLEAAALLAEMARQSRDYPAVARASKLAERALPDAERAVAGSRLLATLGARREAELHLETARAHLARLRGRPSASRWARVATGWAAVPVPYQAAKARWWEALALLQAGDGRRPALRPLMEAWQIAGELPAHPLRRALADLARRARIDLPGGSDLEPLPEAIIRVVPETADELLGGEPARSSGRGRALVPVGPGTASPGRSETARLIGQRLSADVVADGLVRFGLSPRELEVLRVLTDGRTNREIAERLFISDRTVGVHVRHILSKMGVSWRGEAAAIAIRSGLIPSPAVEAAEPSSVEPR